MRTWAWFIPIWKWKRLRLQSMVCGYLAIHSVIIIYVSNRDNGIDQQSILVISAVFGPLNICCCCCCCCVNRPSAEEDAGDSSGHEYWCGAVVSALTKLLVILSGLVHWGSETTAQEMWAEAISVGMDQRRMVSRSYSVVSQQSSGSGICVCSWLQGHSSLHHGLGRRNEGVCEPESAALWWLNSPFLLDSVCNLVARASADGFLSNESQTICVVISVPL